MRYSMVNPLHCQLKQFYLPIIFSVSGREFGTALAEVNAKNYR